MNPLKSGLHPNVKHDYEYESNQCNCAHMFVFIRVLLKYLLAKFVDFSFLFEERFAP